MELPSGRCRGFQSPFTRRLNLAIRLLKEPGGSERLSAVKEFPLVDYSSQPVARQPNLTSVGIGAPVLVEPIEISEPPGIVTF
jgi:hypothetical protein